MATWGWYLAGVATLPVGWLLITLALVLTDPSKVLSIECRHCGRGGRWFVIVEPYNKRPWWWHEKVPAWRHHRTATHRARVAASDAP